MARVIEAVQIFKKVEDVTAAKDEQSPVYLMDELADMARGSIEASEKISDRIAKRLQNKSPVVKFKALRLIRHIVNKGCGQFQRSMQRHASIVREHMQFKGDTDPYKGDTLNQRVRDAAKEAADSLFNTVMAQPINSLGSRIQGFGSSAALPQTSSQGSLSSGAGNGGPVSRAGSASSNARMVGFGSSTYTAPAAAANGNGATGGGYGSAQRGVNRPLTGGYGNDATSGPGSSGGYGGGYNAPAVAAVEVLGSEDQLVESICTPGGMRLAPDPDDLRRFMEAVGALDGLRVAELLRDKMDGSGSWQQLLRALYVLEAVLLQGSTQACGEIAVLFQSDPGPVQAASGHAQAAVRERAARVMKLLLGDATASGGAQAPAPPPPVAVTTQTTRPQPMADLLGGLDMLGSPVHAAQPPQQQLQPAAGSGAGDMFSGLAIPAASAGSPQAFPGANAAQAPGLGGHAASYGHQPQPGHLPQQPYQQPSLHHLVPGPAAPRSPLDPFDLLQPSPHAPSAAYSTSQAHPPMAMPPPQHHQPLGQQHSLQPAYGHPNPNVVGGGGGMVAGGMPPPLGASSALMPGSSNGPAAGHTAHAAARRPPGGPLDEMFADMSLSGSVPAGPRAGGAGSANAYGGGPGGGGAYGFGVPAPAYGGGAGATGYNSNAAGLGGLASGVHPLGGTGAVSAASRPAGHPMVPSGSGIGPAFAGGSNYGGAHQVGLGGAGSAAQQAPPSMHAVPPGELLGGFGASGVGAAGAGPLGAAGAAPWPAGMGAGGYGGTAGPGPAGPGMVTGMGTGGATASVSSTGVGVGNGAGGSMMVGPGGQVRYVGGPGQGAVAVGGGMGAGAGLGPQSQHYGGPGTMAVGGGMAMGTGVGLGPQSLQYAGGVHAGPGQGGWQQQGYPTQQPVGGGRSQQHTAGSSQQQSQQQQRGSEAFDFVLDQFH